MRTSLTSVPADLKNENRKAVLAAFHNSGALTAIEVSQKIGISRQTVKKCIDYFLQIGALSSCGKGESSSVGGKRPEQYMLNTDIYLMCILLHHHEVILNLTDLHYNCVAHWSTGYIRLLSMDMMWDQIRQGAKEIFSQNPEKKVREVCFSVPLGYDLEHRLTLATPFPAWPNSDFGRSLIEPLQDIFPQACDVMITSDGCVAGSAIMHREPERFAHGEVATFYCSTGIGGALFRDGQPTIDSKTLVGTMGHLIVAPEDPELCPCGSHGCLERMVGRKRMRERMALQQDSYAKSCLVDIPLEEISFERIFEGSANGDPFCCSESRYYAKMFAIALRALILLVGPRIVVFQGDFGKADEVFRQELKKRVSEFKYIELQRELEFVYDENELSMEETIGATYKMVWNYLREPERFMNA